MFVRNVSKYPWSACTFSNTWPEPSGRAVSFSAAVAVCCRTYCRSSCQYCAGLNTFWSPYSCSTLAAAVSTLAVSYGQLGPSQQSPWLKL